MLIDGAAHLNCQVLCEVEVPCEEALSQRRQVDWVDEVSALNKVLQLVNELHWNFHVWVAAHLVVEALILLLL